eukprot:SAG25_NODE_84_length_16553_cov_5.346238_1_plen_47_part_00
MELWACGYGEEGLFWRGGGSKWGVSLLPPAAGRFCRGVIQNSAKPH